MEKIKASFLIYESYLESAEDLNDHEFRVYINAIGNYSMYGVEPDFSNEDRAVKIAWKMSKPTTDNANKRFLQNKENGSKGGAPVGNQNARKNKTTENNREQPNDNHNVNDNVNVYENDNDNVTGKEKEKEKEKYAEEEKYKEYGIENDDESVREEERERERTCTSEISKIALQLCTKGSTDEYDKLSKYFQNSVINELISMISNGMLNKAEYNNIPEKVKDKLPNDIVKQLREQ